MSSQNFNKKAQHAIYKVIIFDHSNSARTVLKFDGYKDTTELMNRLGNIDYIGGTTNLAEGLEKARLEVKIVFWVRH